MSKLILKHGTCACSIEKIKNEGLKASTYLTDDNDIALYYAECASDECESDCGDYDVIEVKVDTTALRPDFNSYEEPLTFFRNDYTTSDREWHEMLESGKIPSPKDENDYKTSLDIVKSVLHVSEINSLNLVSDSSVFLSQ